MNFIMSKRHQIGQRPRKYSTLILAAGQSSRMKQSKLQLAYDTQYSFIEQLVNTYLAYGSREIVVVASQPDEAYLLSKERCFAGPFHLIINPSPEKGRFSSVRLGMQQLKSVSGVFLQNIDNPFTQVSLLTSLGQNALEADYVSPTYNGRSGHPALLSKRIVGDIRALSSDAHHLREFLQTYSRFRLETEHKHILSNINTPEEYQKNME